jgi:RHS repeat-associated protein
MKTNPCRTGFTFEVIRESETFQHGGFSVNGVTQAVTPAVSSTPGSGKISRHKLVTEGYSEWLPDAEIDPATQGRYNGEVTSPERRYTGINVSLYANGEAVALNRYNTYDYTGGVAYLGKDILGSVRGVSNEYGKLEERYEYDAFGKPYKGDFGNGVGLGYTGKAYDVITGMYNYGYRDYAPETARFTTADPIRDGANWFAYVNNDPVNWVDLWRLDILTVELFGNFSFRTNSAENSKMQGILQDLFENQPGSRTSLVYNRDPTPGANIIIDPQNNDVGHTWTSLDKEDGTPEQEYGWGYSLGNPLDGQTLPGALLGNGENGTATSTYKIDITPEQSALIADLWQEKVTAETGYNYGGKSVDPNSTFCTEAVVDILNQSGVLSPEESAVINNSYGQWSYSLPSPLPSDLQRAASVLGKPPPAQNNGTFSIRDLKTSTIRDYGAAYFLESIAGQIGLKDVLSSSFGRLSGEILTLAEYLICSEDPFAYCAHWIEGTETAAGRSLSSQRVSDLLHEITAADRTGFFKWWAEYRQEWEYLALDISSISSWSELIEDVEWGYNRDGEKVVQINLCMLMGEKSRLPVS